MKLNTLATALIIASATLCSCVEEMNDPSAEQKESFTQTYIKTFGLIDTEQDWNIASTVRADITLGDRFAARAGDLKIEIYTERPGAKSSVKMATVPAGRKEFAFDFPQYLDKAFVALVDASGTQLYSDYVPIKNGKMRCNMSAPSSRAASGNPARTLLSGSADMYNVSDTYQGPAPQWTIGDIFEIIGNGNPFAERAVTDGMCNLRRYFEVDGKIAADVEYVIGSAPSEVSIDFFHAGTVKTNALGYIYYRDGATHDEILAAKKYFVIEKATEDQITYQGTSDFNTSMWNLNNNTDEADWAVAARENARNGIMTGKKYNLVYFDDNGNASYEFPAGTHIVFFIAIDQGNSVAGGNNIQESMVRYSVDWLNKHHNISQNKCGTGCNDYDNYSNFVTYSWYGKLIFGIEDEGGDDDMNDLMFSIDGDFAPITYRSILVFGDNPVPDVSWILACEDLGGSADFDFNDIVFGVDYNATTRKIQITPLAAGGTLPAYICYNGETVGREIHEWFGVSTTTMVNTRVFTGAADPIEIDYTGEGDFTLTNTIANGNMGGFSILIDGAETSMISAPGKGEAPQMICMPGDWLWPRETERINHAYTLFGEWGANPALIWNKAPESPQLVINWR